MKDSNENQEEKKGVVDNVMERAISRKLLVFAVATALLYLGHDCHDLHWRTNSN